MRIVFQLALILVLALTFAATHPSRPEASTALSQAKVDPVECWSDAPMFGPGSPTADVVALSDRKH